MTIVEFITARLDEVERTATECADLFPAPWVGAFKQVTSEPSGLRDAAIVASTYHSAASHHIERQEPARVLADIAAKRAIIHQHGDGYHECPEGFMDGAETEPHTGWERECPTLIALASVYSDHPDYRWSGIV